MADKAVGRKETPWFLYLLRGLGFLALVGAALLAWRRQSTEMGFATAAAVVLLIVSNWEIGSIKKVKVGFLELERELRQVAEEATAKLRQVQDVAVFASAAALEAIGTVGRINPIGDVERINWRDRIAGELRQLGVSEEKITNATGVIDAIVCFDHVQAVRRVAYEAEGKDHERCGPFSTALGAICDWRDRRIPTADRVRELLKAHGLGGDEVDERLADLEYFEQHRKLRRPEVWGNE